MRKTSSRNITSEFGHVFLHNLVAAETIILLNVSVQDFRISIVQINEPPTEFTLKGVDGRTDR